MWKLQYVNHVANIWINDRLELYASFLIYYAKLKKCKDLE